MIRSLLIRGMLMGLLAGLIAFGFARVFGEPSVERAIQFEGQMHETAHGHDHAQGGDHADHADHAQGGAEDGAATAASAQEEEEPELFSREVQSGIGLLTAVAVYGAGLGGIFALVFAFAYGRVTGLGPRNLAGVMALFGFVTVVLVPMLKYPANPPSVGAPETIGSRTGLYLAMLVMSLVCAALSLKVRKFLTSSLSKWHASVVAAVFFVILVGAVMYMLPSINEVPARFPADLLWNFRVASLGIQLIIWAGLGLLFGEAIERYFKQRT